MKRTRNILILVSLTIMFFSFNIFAQKPVTKKDSGERAKQDEIAIKKFVKSFIKSLANTKDIDKVPRRFFVTDFRKRFAEYQDSGDIMNSFGIDEQLFSKLSRKRRNEYLVLRFNFNILPMMLTKLSDLEDLSKKADDKETSENPLAIFEVLFPPHIFEILKNTKHFSKSIDSDYKITNLADLKILISEMRTVLDSLRSYLNQNYLPKYNSWFSEEMREMVNQANWNESDGFCGKCKNECRELPKNTKYIYIGGFLLRLTILKINRKFKVFDTPVWEDASSRFP